MKNNSKNQLAKQNKATIIRSKGMHPVKFAMFVFMAKIRLGDNITDLSGSTGGTTYSKNRGGHYRKNKPMPINPNSSFQIAVRSSFGTLSQAWRSLTDAQRAAWNAMAPQYPYLDVFGVARTPSGFQLYKTLNGNLDSVGATRITTPLPPAAVTAVTFTVSAYDDTTGPTAAFTATPLAATTSLLIEATSPYSAGISNVSNKYRIVKVWPTTTTSAVMAAAIAANLVTKFGSSVGMVGSKVSFRISTVNTATGQSSPYSYVTSTLT